MIVVQLFGGHYCYIGEWSGKKTDQEGYRYFKGRYSTGLEMTRAYRLDDFDFAFRGFLLVREDYEAIE